MRRGFFTAMTFGLSCGTAGWSGVYLIGACLGRNSVFPVAAEAATTIVLVVAFLAIDATADVSVLERWRDA